MTADLVENNMDSKIIAEDVVIQVSYRFAGRCSDVILELIAPRERRSYHDNLTSFPSEALVTDMETLQLPVGEFKSRFSEALEVVARGGSVCITYGRSRKPVALFSPPPRPAGKRKLGTLAGKVKFHISKDWSLPAEEFVDP